MRDEIYDALHNLTAAVDACRQAAFAVRSIRGNSAMSAFSAFDNDLTSACATFVESVKNGHRRRKPKTVNRESRW